MTKIELDKNIYWNKEKEIQDEDVLMWINQNILSKMSLNNSEKDKYGRPTKWKFKMNSYTIEVVREYVFPNSGKWAKKCDKVNIYD